MKYQNVLPAFIVLMILSFGGLPEAWSAQAPSQGLFAEGYALLEAGIAAQALTKFEAGLKVDPRNALAQFYVGKIYFDLGETDKAKRHLQASLDVDPASEAAEDAKSLLKKISGGASGAKTDGQGQPKANQGAGAKNLQPISPASTATLPTESQTLVDRDFGSGVSQFKFGMGINDVNRVLSQPFSDVSWGGMAIASEFKTSEVRYFWQHLNKFSSLPLQSLYSSCGNSDNSYFSFMFDRNQQLFRMSLRLGRRCTARAEFLKHFVQNYRLQEKQNGNVRFREETNRIVLVIYGNENDDFILTDWYPKGSQLNDWPNN